MGFMDFLRFRQFITTGFIMVIYILGAIIITAASILAMAGFTYTIPGVNLSGFGIIIGVIMLIFGNLAWRILCEYLVVQFRIFDALSSIDSKTKGPEGAPLAPPPTAPSAPATPTCPTCGRPLTFVAQYNRWYCEQERKYV